MKRIFLLLLSLTLLTSCGKEASFKVFTEERNLIDDEHCLIAHRYPVIRGIRDSMTAVGINQYLKEALQLKYRLRDCLQDSLGQRSVLLGDFSTVQLNEDLISLELSLESQKMGSNTRQYFPVTLQMPEAYNPPLDLLLGDGVLNQLLPYLEAWKSEKEGRNFNREAYQAGSNYALPYCLSADSLILYPGSEGEMLAQNRISIALENLR